MHDEQWVKTGPKNQLLKIQAALEKTFKPKKGTKKKKTKKEDDKQEDPKEEIEEEKKEAESAIKLIDESKFPRVYLSAIRMEAPLNIISQQDIENGARAGGGSKAIYFNPF